GIERGWLDRQAVLALEPFGVGLAEERLELAAVALGVLHRFLGGFDDPFRFAQYGVGVDRPGDAVQDASVGGAEVAGDVAALFLTADDAEGGDFLEGGDEVFVEVLADFGVGQGVHTGRLGIVSGDARIFKVAGNVQHEAELQLLLGDLGRLAGRIDEINASAVRAAGSLVLAWGKDRLDGLDRSDDGARHGGFAVQLGGVDRGQPHERRQAQPGSAGEKTTHYTLPPSWGAAPQGVRGGVSPFSSR